MIPTGGFKSREQAIEAVSGGAVDMVGVGQAMALNHQLANTWLSEEGGDPEFPHFNSRIPGGITAWYTMRLIALGEDREKEFLMDLPTAIRQYEERDAKRCFSWYSKFFPGENFTES